MSVAIIFFYPLYSRPITAFKGKEAAEAAYAVKTLKLSQWQINSQGEGSDWEDQETRTCL